MASFLQRMSFFSGQVVSAGWRHNPWAAPLKPQTPTIITPPNYFVHLYTTRSQSLNLRVGHHGLDVEASPRSLP